MVDRWSEDRRLMWAQRAKVSVKFSNENGLCCYPLYICERENDWKLKLNFDRTWTCGESITGVWIEFFGIDEQRKRNIRRDEVKAKIKVSWESSRKLFSSFQLARGDVQCALVYLFFSFNLPRPSSNILHQLATLLLSSCCAHLSLKHADVLFLLNKQPLRFK